MIFSPWLVLNIFCVYPYTVYFGYFSYIILVSLIHYGIFCKSCTQPHHLRIWPKQAFYGGGIIKLPTRFWDTNLINCHSPKILFYSYHETICGKNPMGSTELLPLLIQSSYQITSPPNSQIPNQNKQLRLFPFRNTDITTSMASSVKVFNSTRFLPFLCPATCQIEHRNWFAFVEMAVLEAILK